MHYAVSLLLSLVFGPSHCIPQVFDAVVSLLLLLMFGSLSLYLSSVLCSVFNMVTSVWVPVSVSLNIIFFHKRNKLYFLISSAD